MDNESNPIHFIKGSIEKYNRIKVGSNVCFQLTYSNGKLLACHITNIHKSTHKLKYFIYIDRKNNSYVKLKTIKRWSIAESVDFLPYWKANKNILKNNCLICLDDYEDNNELTTLPCLHFFHKNCILKWLDSHVTCPICKNQAIKEAKHPIMSEPPFLFSIQSPRIYDVEQFYENIGNSYLLLHPPVRILSYNF